MGEAEANSMSITNPTYDNLAQTAHALAGYGIALTPARFGTVPLLVGRWLIRRVRCHQRVLV
jgi:hypothetical protein